MSGRILLPLVASLSIDTVTFDPLQATHCFAWCCALLTPRESRRMFNPRSIEDSSDEWRLEFSVSRQTRRLASQCLGSPGKEQVRPV